MKRKLGFVATVVLLSGFVSTNAFAAGGGGPASGQAGVIAGSAGVGALAVGRGGVGLIAGSPRPFISLIAPGNVGASPSGTGALPSSIGASPSSIGASPSSIGALPIGQGLGRGAGSSGPIISLMPRSLPVRASLSLIFIQHPSTPASRPPHKLTSAVMLPRARMARVEPLTGPPLPPWQEVGRRCHKSAVISPAL
jgi:hypothetical protein